MVSQKTPGGVLAGTVIKFVSMIAKVMPRVIREGMLETMNRENS